MNFHLWLAFAATEVVLCLTPGPAVLTVVSQAVRWGSRSSLLGALGILAGNAVYFGLSACGLGAALAASATLFAAIKWTGVAVLVLMGAQMLRAREDGEHKRIASADASRLFVQGFVTQVSNPKAIVFFTAFLPQFVNPRGHVPLQFLLLGLTSEAIELLVLASYGVLAERGTRLTEGRFARVADRVAGGLLMTAAVALGFATR